jgi:hypothetical protein
VSSWIGAKVSARSRGAKARGSLSELLLTLASAVVLSLPPDVEESIANAAYDSALRKQQAKLAAQQAAFAAQQALLLQQEAEATGDWSRVAGGKPPPIDGRRPRAPRNAGLGDVKGVKPFWYENAEPEFTADMIKYNARLRANLAQAGVRA